MKHEDKKHFDVSKPRRRGPDPTSKPIIVGHHPMMPDPMIKEEREKAPKPITVISDGDEAEPLKVTKSGSVAEDLGVKPDDNPEVKPVEEPLETKLETPPEHASEPPTTTPEVPPEAAPGAIFHPPEKTAEAEVSATEPMAEPKTDAPEAAGADPTATAAIAGAAVAATAADASAEALPGTEQSQPATAEPPVGQELHIPAGHGHAQVRHKPRIWVWVTIGIIILIWIYAAVDALTNTKLPLEFFENSGQTAQQVTNAPVQTTSTQSTTPPPSTPSLALPAGWSWYQAGGYELWFGYPKNWAVKKLTKVTDPVAAYDGAKILAQYSISPNQIPESYKLLNYSTNVRVVDNANSLSPKEWYQDASKGGLGQGVVQPEVGETESQESINGQSVYSKFSPYWGYNQYVIASGKYLVFIDTEYSGNTDESVEAVNNHFKSDYQKIVSTVTKLD